jgi:alkaline phosphatase
MRFFRDICVIITVICFLTPAAFADRKDDNHRLKKEGYKNIIFMVPDGCSQSIQTLARWYKGEDLTVDSLNAGMVRIDMANSVITGSAAAATAFATGHKTTVRFLGVGPRGNDLLYTFDDYDAERAYAPMATILEMAKDKDKSTGLVATSRITHATPAAFASHIADRGWDNDIMEHMVYNNLDVSLGGAKRHLYPKGGIDLDEDGVADDLDGDGFPETGGNRTDGQNLIQVLLDRGYSFVTTKAAMDQVNSGKLWGAFNESHMDAEIDRPIYNPTEPSIADMTAKAIELLSQNVNGFFLMVEGSQVDWAGHNNDPIHMVTDFIAFDDAVKVAVDFAKKDGDTLVIAFPDHNTGGLKIGQYYQQMSYTATKVDDLVGPLHYMTRTANSVVSEMGGDFSEDTMIATIKEYWGIEATSEDVTEINELAPSVGMSYALARVITKNHTVLGWTTHGHNGEDVPVWIYPQSEAIGTIDNTELPDVEAFWGDERGPKTLDKLTKKLYINVEDAFPGEWVIEDNVLKVKECAELPLNKDLLIINGKERQLGSLVVYAPLRDGVDSDGPPIEDDDGNCIAGCDDDIHTIVEDRVYIPKKAVKKIDRKCN